MATRADVRRAVIEDLETKTWLAHPAAPDAVAALHREIERDSDQAMLAFIVREQEASRPWRQEPPVLLPSPPREPTEAQRIEELPEQLGLTARARWPRCLAVGALRLTAASSARGRTLCREIWFGASMK